jgi:hypothetical protein
MQAQLCDAAYRTSGKVRILAASLDEPSGCKRFVGRSDGEPQLVPILRDSDNVPARC